MTTQTHLIHSRRFLPLFVTQLLNAFNDNLFKTAMVLFVVYTVYNSEADEGLFSAVASAVFILPFFVLSAVAGQLADMRDKARIIRIVKASEIGIMLVGAAGMLLAWQGFAMTTLAIPLMLLALFGMGVHSTFFGPIKYAILPQHLYPGEVLAGTGLVEAGTYIAILAGTILAGWIPVQWAAVVVVATAVVGYFTSRAVPPAPPHHEPEPLDFHLLRASYNLVRNTSHDRRGVSGDHGDQLFLDDRDGVVCPVSAAGQKRAERQQGSGQPVSGDLFDRCGDRLDVGQRAA